ncbi:MAG: type II/IV secretion system protein, partial [Comamonas sp.]|nr:type II/IV secretion system protein [Candidatus Comamonas equi]
PEMLAQFMAPWKFNGSFTPYEAVGCEACRMTGFKGRKGLYELLPTSETLQQHIHQTPSMEALRRQAVQDGMRPLRLSGALRVAEGLTTLAEVIATTPPLR